MSDPEQERWLAALAGQAPADDETGREAAAVRAYYRRRREEDTQVSADSQDEVRMLNYLRARGAFEPMPMPVPVPPPLPRWQRWMRALAALPPAGAPWTAGLATLMVCVISVSLYRVAGVPPAGQGQTASVTTAMPPVADVGAGKALTAAPAASAALPGPAATALPMPVPKVAPPSGPRLALARPPTAAPVPPPATAVEPAMPAAKPDLEGLTVVGAAIRHSDTEMPLPVTVVVATDAAAQARKPAAAATLAVSGAAAAAQAPAPVPAAGLASKVAAARAATEQNNVLDKIEVTGTDRTMRNVFAQTPRAVPVTADSSAVPCAVPDVRPVVDLRVQTADLFVGADPGSTLSEAGRARLDTLVRQALAAQPKGCRLTIWLEYHLKSPDDRAEEAQAAARAGVLRDYLIERALALGQEPAPVPAPGEMPAPVDTAAGVAAERSLDPPGTIRIQLFPKEAP